MSLFPLSGDKIQLTSAAVDASDAYQNGIRVSAGTSLARTATSDGAQFNNGLLMSNSGQIVYVDATAGLPANTQYCNGIPLSSTGRCVYPRALWQPIPTVCRSRLMALLPAR